MQQQLHVEGSVRHAEKRRKGTCQFANRIARASLDAYGRSVPQSYREANKQTCVAAIVAHFRHPGGSSTPDTEAAAADRTSIDHDAGDNSSNSHLQVMGLGVGTKFLPDAIVREEQLDTCEEGYGRRIRDCHAEVLARRAFRCQVALEILSDLNSDNGKEQGEKAGGSNVDADYSPILERIEGHDDDCSHDGKLIAAKRIRYKLRSGVTLHFYASSAPCGNAVLKKFVKMTKENFDASLGPDEWPKQIHAPIAAHSLRQGQFAVLVKKDGSVSQPDLNKDSAIDPAETQQRIDADGRAVASREKKRRKPWPCRESDSWCPPSCSITGFGKGTLHSCSDKLCRWNCLGMQGSLLMPVLDSPLHMTTVTIGRKFSRSICSRAICCRAEGFGSSSTNTEDGSYGTYKLNHPTLLETNVYMDESGTHAMAGVKDVGRDASFDSNLCWVWWPEKASDFEYVADCLDAKIGLTIRYHNNAQSGNQDATTLPALSACSTFSLFHLNTEILRRSAVSNVSTEKGQAKLSLSDLRRLKCQLSSRYESAKTEFFRHRVFSQWSCRDCR